MNKTPNYQLSQWEASDQLRRVDVNADNAKIDAALKTQADALSAAAAAILKIHIGTYVGDGTWGGEHLTSLTFPFEPKFVAITSNRSAGYFIRGGNGICNWNGNGCSNWPLFTVWSGRTLSWCTGQVDAEKQLNTLDTTYTYLAIG